MLEIVPTLNFYVALAGIFGQLVTVGLILAFFLRSRSEVARSIVQFTGERGLLLAFLASLGASILTLFYSETIGFTPCPLCWWQRVFLYPQVVLLGMALWKKDSYVAEYSIALSVFGFFVAMYQHLLQVLPDSGLPCPATGASCSIRILFEFGYVTYPLLAATLFAFLIVVMGLVCSRRAS